MIQYNADTSRTDARSRLKAHAWLLVAQRQRSHDPSIRVLGPVAPISVNFNHQLAYFADQSDTTHVAHQPTAVA